MNAHTDAEIVEAFLAHHKFALDKDRVLRRLVDSQWAVELVWDLAYDDPIHCWKILCAIVMLTPPDDAMSAAGAALTAVLRQHPSPNTVETIEQDVAANNRLSELLSWVSKDEPIDPDVWCRIETLSRTARPPG